MKKLILSNFQSPGDIVMLTAAVRDLHRNNPGNFVTDVRTPCDQLWENNPLVTPIADNDPEAETIDCDYPLIHRSNHTPWHFIHGFHQFLEERLEVRIPPTEFKGDLYISDLEKSWISQIHEILEEDIPFWVVSAGGKRDFTIKWWETARFQRVVDHFRGRVLFVQIGESGHYHPPLKGVIDLRGKTDLRQLVRLVYHSQGVLSPVTLLMHLAAAVEVKDGMPQNRPCVVVAGGREPAQWEAYTHHQYIHTVGALLCCDHGGCWKARTVPLGDGDEKDLPENLCVDVVRKASGSRPRSRKTGSAPGEAIALPRCMDMITAEEVIRRIEIYFAGGSIRYLYPDEWKCAHGRVKNMVS